MDFSPLSKIFVLLVLGFSLALALTPLLTEFLHKKGLGKKIRNDGSTPIFSQLHASKAGTPSMGGILIWGSVATLALVMWFFDRFLNIGLFHQLNFLTRRETLLPLGAFLGASAVGLIDDWLEAKQLGPDGRGLRFRFKVWLYALVAAIGAWWFYFKLEFTTINIPGYGNWEIGWWFIPFFILTVVAVSFAVNQTDGLDGLAGGTLMLGFLSYSLIAFWQGKYDLATFLACVCGALLAFLWFNVHPAKFFMGDTGSMGMGVLLAIVAFLTNAILILPIIGLVFVLEAVSTVAQIASKKIFHRKIFLSSPLHQHFQALGWPESKVTMRFWIISAVSSIIGLVIFFIS
jgi:phospho-N-acetylmuramoyl-pentapeptide-transferase